MSGLRLVRNEVLLGEQSDCCTYAFSNKTLVSANTLDGHLSLILDKF